MVPKYIFEADGARVCEIPDNDQKSRFTVELAAAGNGNILPYFIVIKKNGQPVHLAEEFEHVQWYLQHEDGHVITCQPKVWMDIGGFAMYIETVLAPWWLKEQT